MSGRVAASVALVLVLALTASAAGVAEDRGDLDEYAGMTIVRIVVDPHNLFDPPEDGDRLDWPYRLANAINVVTRKGFIRNSLLFDEGEPFDPDLALESARLLRSLGFLNPVTVSAREVEGGVEVTVTTRDRWSLEIGGSLGVFGGSSTSSFEVGEENLIGTGQSVAVEYSTDEGRTEWSYTYRNPLVLGSRWQLEVGHRDRSDGEGYHVSAVRPFFALATESAYGGEYRNLDREVALRAEAADAVVGRRDTLATRAWIGRLVARRGDTIHRLRFGFDHTRDLFEDWRFEADGRPYPTPEDREIAGPSLGYELVTDDFRVIQGYRAWTLQEDVALGPAVEARVVASAPVFGGDRQRFVVDGQYKHSILEDGWLLTGALAGGGRFEHGRGLVNGSLRLDLVAAKLGTEGWRARLMVEDTVDPDLDVQLTLGADQGLRGWEPDTFDGTGRSVLNLQWRRLVARNLWNVMSIGMTGFADAGMTWGARVAEDTDGVRSNLGVGVLVELTKFSAQEFIRLEVAWPDDGTGPLVSVSTSTLF